MTQLTIFDQGKANKRITKPIRLIELFAGYGSQSFALKYLGVPFEHHKICEWALPSIRAYKDAHFGADEKDYSEGKTVEEIKEYFKGRISSNYNEPMTDKQINAMKEKTAREIYSDMQATHNLGSVCLVHGSDLEITDTDKYEYILTYSFPCQDLSNSGKRAGMAKGSGTRSGMLWEVERILNELHENGNLPQILIMENVPAVCGTKNISVFAEWLAALENLGYSNYWKILNATDYKIPQNRERCFMVSLLGDEMFEFPAPHPLDLRLRDVLERNVDEKYYLSDKAIEGFIAHTEKMQEKGNGFKFEPTRRGGTLTVSQHAPEADATTILLNCCQENAPTIKCQYARAGTANFARHDGMRAPAIVEFAGGGIDGVIIGQSERFSCGGLIGISRTITTQDNAGVIEWQKRNASLQEY